MSSPKERELLTLNGSTFIYAQIAGEPHWMRWGGHRFSADQVAGSPPMFGGSTDLDPLTQAVVQARWEATR